MYLKKSSKTEVFLFSKLMESEMDGIEVSYNAVGIFSHITADGENAWTISQPTRKEVMMRMMRAIKRWPLESKRNINYRYKNLWISSHPEREKEREERDVEQNPI